MQSTKTLLATALVVFSGSSLLLAQTDRATLTGSVTDQSGALIPGATVTAIHTATNASRNVQTNATGEFVLPQLVVGDYNIKAEAPGFKSSTTTGVTLSPGATIRADIKLEVGQITESVSVSAQASLIQTDTARVQTAVSPKFIEDLPLVVGGQLRSPLDLVSVVPEAKGGGNITVAGGQEGGWDLTIDGFSATPAAPFEQRLWTMVNSPSVDALQEFAVDTNGFKAEFGHAGGGAFAFVSKSGTNQFHGNLYEFLRNDFFDANLWFNNAQNRKRPILRQHDFGGTVGGPVWIPKVYDGRNKTFFFYSMEKFRNRTGPRADQFTIPLPEMYEGDFSNWKDANGVLLPIYDPTTTKLAANGTTYIRDPFPGNKIPANRFSQVAKNVLPLATMRPNLPDPTGRLNPNPRNNFVTTTGSQTDPWDKWSMKGDQIFNSSNRIGFMYQKNRTQQLPIGDPPGLPGALNATFQFGDTWTDVWRGTYDRNIGSNILNHITVGFNDWGQVRRAGDPSYNQGWAPKIGLKNTGIPDLLFPRFNFDGYSPWGRDEYGGSYNKTAGFSDDLNWVKGAHTLKFGYQFQEDHYNGYGSHTASGSTTFQRGATSVPGDQTGNSGNGFASFLLGWVGSAGLQTERFVSDQWKYHAVYAQDDWRVNPKLSVSYGVRWEYTPPTVEGWGPDYYMNFNPTIPNTFAGGRLGAVEFAGTGEGRTGTRSLYPAWPWGFSPRLGAAYTLNQDTVIRLSAARTFGSMKNTGGSSHWQGFIGEYSFTSPGNALLEPAFMLDNGFPSWPKPPFLNPAGVQPNNPAANTTRFWQASDSGRLPEYYNWSLSIQRAIPGNMVLDLGYNAQLGRHLATNQVQINQIDPNVFLDYVRRSGTDIDVARQFFQNTDINSPAAAAAGFVKPFPNFTGTVRQSLRPYPQFNDILTDGDGGDRSGSSTYHAMVVKWEKRYSSGLTFLNSYVFSKTLSDVGAANATGSSTMTHYNRALNKAVAGNDQTHILKFSYSYELPFGKGKPFLAGGVGNAVLGGWRIAGIQQYASGTAMSLGTSYNPWAAVYAGNRVSVTSLEGWKNENYTGDKFDPNADNWFDRSQILGCQATATFGCGANILRDGVTDTPPSSAAIYVAKNSFGNAPPRNPSVRSPWQLNENVTLSRTLRFGEGVRLDIRAEGFNLLNRVRWGGPDTGINNQNFGRVTSQGNTPRQIQLGMKLNF
jgi:hypothetical protein